MVSGNGMMILNDTAYLAENWRSVQAACLAFTFLFIIIAFVIESKKLAIASAFIAVVLGFSSFSVTLNPNHYETQYQVIFDDSVSANEVYDKYDVVKISGKIWTIREKQDVKN